MRGEEQRDRYIDREIESEGGNEGEIPGRAKGPSAEASILFSTGQETFSPPPPQLVACRKKNKRKYEKKLTSFKDLTISGDTTDKGGLVLQCSIFIHNLG